MATNKELTAKNRELKQQVKKLTMVTRERMQKNAMLDEENDELKEALSGFDSSAYKTYLGLAKWMGKKDDQIIDISIRLGLLKRVCELAASRRPIEEEEEEDAEED